jgi:glycosyltransferase involved in cell wall biosynthesis
MRIWLVNPSGSIPGEGWRPYRYTLISEELVRKGHVVTWWTATFSHHVKQVRAEGFTVLSQAPGFEIKLVPCSTYKEHIGLRRLWFFFTFSMNLWRLASVEGCRPECIIVVSPAPGAELVAALLSKRFDAPLIVDFMDLWPEVFLCVVPDAPVLRSIATFFLIPFTLLRTFAVRRAAAVTALCETYVAVASAVLPRGCGVVTRVIFNGLDVRSFREDMSRCAARAVHVGKELAKEEGEVWAIFAGTLGRNYDLLTVIRGARLLKVGNRRVRILVAGEGPLGGAMADAHAKGIVTYLGRVPFDELPTYYQLCDVGLCPYARDSPVAMPVKVYDYLAAGLAILSSLPGEFESLVRREGIGVQYVAGDAESFAAALTGIAADDAARRLMAARAYRLAMAFDRDAQYASFSELVELVRRERA